MRYQREMEALLEKAERSPETVEAHHMGGIAGFVEEVLARPRSSELKWSG